MINPAVNTETKLNFFTEELKRRCENGNGVLVKLNTGIAEVYFDEGGDGLPAGFHDLDWSRTWRLDGISLKNPNYDIVRLV